MLLPLLLTASFPISQYAQATAPYRPRLTGEQLVRDMTADPFVGANGIQRQRAMGYIEGVMDAFVGKQWCPAGKAVPHELNYLLTEDIARLDATLLKEEAAALLVAALAKQYPCTQPGAKR